MKKKVEMNSELMGVQTPQAKWTVINSLKAPVTLSYAGKVKTLGAGGRWIIDNRDLLGPIPNGVRVVPFVQTA